MKNLRRTVAHRQKNSTGQCIDYLLGMDFLEIFGIIFDFKEGKLGFRGEDELNCRQTMQIIASPVERKNFIMRCLGSALDSSYTETSFHLKFFFHGHTRNAIVDSGSDVSVLRTDCQQILKDSITLIEQRIIQVDQSCITVSSQVTMLISLENATKSMACGIYDLQVENCLLGVEFLKLFGVRINFGRRTWKICRRDKISSFDDMTQKSPSCESEICK